MPTSYVCSNTYGSDGLRWMVGLGEANFTMVVVVVWCKVQHPNSTVRLIPARQRRFFDDPQGLIIRAPSRTDKQ